MALHEQASLEVNQRGAQRGVPLRPSRAGVPEVVEQAPYWRDDSASSTQWDWQENSPGMKVTGTTEIKDDFHGRRSGWFWSTCRIGRLPGGRCSRRARSRSVYFEASLKVDMLFVAMLTVYSKLPTDRLSTFHNGMPCNFPDQHERLLDYRNPRRIPLYAASHELHSFPLHERHSPYFLSRTASSIHRLNAPDIQVLLQHLISSRNPGGLQIRQHNRQFSRGARTLN
jgi:hypothetical protein